MKVLFIDVGPNIGVLGRHGSLGLGEVTDNFRALRRHEKTDNCGKHLHPQTLTLLFQDLKTLETLDIKHCS